MKKTIKVKQKHIDNGQPANHSKCPIALAGSEQLGNTCIVERFDMKLSDGEGKWFGGYLPQKGGGICGSLRLWRARRGPVRVRDQLQRSSPVKSLPEPAPRPLSEPNNKVKMTTTKRTYTLTRRQCDTIKEQDRVYVLNARNLMKNTGTKNPDGSYVYPAWIQPVLKRLAAEAMQRWMKANPIPSTVIAVAFDNAHKAERRAA